jgi:2'-5' RNA ligase
MRIFLAVFPSTGVRETAFGVIERLRRPGDGVAWVKRENLHYTLRFLGELDEDDVSRATEAAREAAAAQPSFTARLGELGGFPSMRRARVLWLGLSEGAEALVSLAQHLERALVTRGFEATERPFSAHLTLGRIREGGADWSGRLAEAGGPGVPAAAAPAPVFTVDRLSVVQSTLARGGSIYQVRADPALAGVTSA